MVGRVQNTNCLMTFFILADMIHESYVKSLLKGACTAAMLVFTTMKFPSSFWEFHANIFCRTQTWQPGIITQSQLKYACATCLIATLICLSGSYLHMQLMPKFTSTTKSKSSRSVQHRFRYKKCIPSSFYNRSSIYHTWSY